MPPRHLGEALRLQQRRRQAGRRPAAGVEPVQRVRSRFVDDREQIAADAVDLRLDEAHDRVGRDGGVDRVAAALEDLHAGLRRQRLAGGDDAELASRPATARSESSFPREILHSTLRCPAAISSRFPVRPTCPIGSCAPSRSRRSTIAVRRSRCSRKETLDAQDVFQTSGPVVIYPSSGTGAWEAALVNTLSPGDTVLMVETGQFATLWRDMAERLGLDVDFVPGDWRHGVDAAVVGEKLAPIAGARDQGRRGRAQRDVDRRHERHRRQSAARSTTPGIRRCCSSTTSRRSASIDYRHDEWRVDVTDQQLAEGDDAAAGLGFNAISAKALAASKSARLPRAYWDWQPMIARQRRAAFSRRRRRSICCSDCARRCACCEEEGLRERLRAPRALRAKRRGAPSRRGGSSCSARESGRVQQRADRRA